ncbi:uncharacterized protein K452DRAFT_27292 [Aplosporella prunicola CBS 121167]|uniref:Uncharacterized protein n=1 Tax=Aplosporella prunicola CBS 121167 TaxID=1176127 RepID=A0A6A6BDL6_9PEZI|nr:uncharacterized protein K452DRAFT_27292 [Aplosporella prunicola CBS 121167]KAF2142146.1 hypothetical protein K452DRAFT_27292 [Aplosporella prunicola CBS 121167]
MASPLFLSIMKQPDKYSDYCVSQQVQEAHFICCKCGTASSLSPQRTLDHDEISCSKCRNFICFKCEIKTRLIRPTQLLLHRTTAKSRQDTRWGFFCCQCGSVEEVLPSTPWPLIDPTDKELYINYENTQCSYCEHFCYDRCLRFTAARDPWTHYEHQKSVGSKQRKANFLFRAAETRSKITAASPSSPLAAPPMTPAQPQSNSPETWRPQCGRDIAIVFRNISSRYPDEDHRTKKFFASVGRCPVTSNISALDLDTWSGSKQAVSKAWA